MQPTVAFFDDSLNPAVRGFLHSPANPNGDALILTHGAGSDCTVPLLVALGEIFAEHGYVVLRSDLPFRQERRTGPPFPGNAERDRAGLRTAVAALRQSVAGRIFLGGHSYGGRQSTLLCAAERELVQPDSVKSDAVKPELVSGLLVLSIRCTPRASRNNSASSTCPVCTLRASSCMERATPSEAWKRWRTPCS